MVLTNDLSLTDADYQYLARAEKERALSDDPKAKRNPSSAVGAVLVGRSGVIAASANVLPAGLTKIKSANDSTFLEENRYFFVEHAERSVIFQALLQNRSTAQATLYCTRFACADCARAIITAGIGRAVFSTGFSNEGIWLTSQRAGLYMMEAAGVRVDIVNNE